MLQRVAKHQYLFRRGARYYFRRAVPKDVTHAFGGKAHITVSLNTDSLAEARHALGRRLRDFDRTLAEARATPDPTLAGIAPSSSLRTPERDEIDAVVRAWLRTQEAEIVTRAISLPKEQLDQGANELGHFEMMVRKALRGRGGDNLLLSWIAEHVADTQGWDCPQGTYQRSYLEMRLARGQLEWGRITRSEYTLEPHQQADAFFSPDHAGRDAVVLERFKQQAPVPIWDLFDGWVREHKPAPATIKAWKTCLRSLIDHLGHDNAAQVKRADIVSWKDALLTPKGDGSVRSARTVRDKYLASAKTVFGWGENNLRIAENPVCKVVLVVPKKPRLREDAGFTDAEARIILSASLKALDDTRYIQRAFARRWVPWICAYTGARVGEITQMRAEDVHQGRGVFGASGLRRKLVVKSSRRPGQSHCIRT